ncbi:GTPase/DUF3482 domain-containing protein [Thermodesulfobacteriota bacterium]
MTEDRIPEFAIVGHPNEGKSSVVSTLSEDDSVRISSRPGETVICQVFPVTVDEKEIIRFTDTPGFQNPKKILAWMRNYQATNGCIVHAFRETHAQDPTFKEDCELFQPIERGAGIIYIADGSRPVRKVDLAEMEVFRLTGRPRMAIINSKEDNTDYLEEWKNEFRKHFNAIRVFNAHKATYAERIDLLESLKSIDQDWASSLDTVISAFKEDWKQRNVKTARNISDMLEECLTFSMTKNFTELTDEDALKKRLSEDFNRSIEKIEKNTHQKIRKLFKHNIFNYDLSSHSILKEDLFSEKTWKFLGLTPKQLTAAAGVTGVAIGAALDIVAAGLTFGVFTALGGLLGAGWVALGGGKKLAKTKVVGVNLGGQQIRIGSITNIQFMYVLLDRALIIYSHIINWAHGRREYKQELISDKGEKSGYTSGWDNRTKNMCNAFFISIKKNDETKKEQAGRAFRETLEEELLGISRSERRVY